MFNSEDASNFAFAAVELDALHRAVPIVEINYIDKLIPTLGSGLQNMGEQGTLHTVLEKMSLVVPDMDHLVTEIRKIMYMLATRPPEHLPFLRDFCVVMSKEISNMVVSYRRERMHLV